MDYVPWGNAPDTEFEKQDGRSGRVKKRQILFIPKPMEQQTGFTCYASLDMA